MTWPATTRYDLDPAPGALALVQDFVNTIPAGSPRGADLLAELSVAQSWLDSALVEWCRWRGLPTLEVVLSEADLGKLKSLRADLVDRVRAGGTDNVVGRPSWDSVSAAVRLLLDESGRVQLLPSGKGWRLVASALLIEMHEARLGDTWRRLKTCSNHRCSAAFFDRSRNNSRVWHDGSVCGNLANLHAHRARKRTEAGREDGGRGGA
jgi:hypothetical protein